MIALAGFRSRAEIEAERNLAAFIRHARATFSQLPTRAGLRWDDSAWPGARWVKLTVGKRRRIGSDDRLDPRFIDFAKAYSVWKGTHRPSASHWEHQALRCIESALITKTGAGSIGGLSIGALDEAASAARSRFTHPGSIPRRPGDQPTCAIRQRQASRRLRPFDVEVALQATIVGPAHRPRGPR